MPSVKRRHRQHLASRVYYRDQYGRFARRYYRDERGRFIPRPPVTPPILPPRGPDGRFLPRQPKPFDPWTAEPHPDLRWIDSALPYVGGISDITSAEVNEQTVLSVDHPGFQYRGRALDFVPVQLRKALDQYYPVPDPGGSGSWRLIPMFQVKRIINQDKTAWLRLEVTVVPEHQELVKAEQLRVADIGRANETVETSDRPGSSL